MVIDVQNDFISGTLAVQHGAEVVPVTNRYTLSKCDEHLQDNCNKTVSKIRVGKSYFRKLQFKIKVQFVDVNFFNVRI